jgi:hypothetical protein
MWIPLIVVVLGALGIVGRMFLPAAEREAATNYLKAIFLYIDGGLIYIAAFLGDEVVARIMRAAYIVGGVIIVASLLMFASFALNIIWLTQFVAGVMVFVFFGLFLVVKLGEGKRIVGGLSHGLSLGFGVILVILASLALVQWGVGDIEAAPVSYAVWGVFLFGAAWYTFNRMRNKTGFFGLGCILAVGALCLTVGILTRGFPTEAANLKSKYGLSKKSSRLETLANNATIARRDVVVKSPVGKYERASSFFSSGDSIVLSPVMKDGKQEEVSPGTYRMLEDATHLVGDTGDTAIFVGKPNQFGEMAASTDRFYIILSPGKVELGKKESEDSTSESSKTVSSTQPMLKRQYSSGSGWTIDPPAFTPCSDLPTLPAQVEADGTETVKLIVPATSDAGVASVGEKDRGVMVNVGDEFTVDVDQADRVKFSGDHPCVDALGMAGWYDPKVDSPFTNNVGGLEFAVGSLSADRTNRFLPGFHKNYVAQKSGPLVFRVIERIDGYHDNNSGYFKVTVTIVRRASSAPNPST